MLLLAAAVKQSLRPPGYETRLRGGFRSAERDAALSAPDEEGGTGSAPIAAACSEPRVGRKLGQREIPQNQAAPKKYTTAK